MSLRHLYMSSLTFSSTYSAYIYLFSAYLLSIIYLSLLCLFPILLHFYLYSSAYICVSSAHFQFFSAYTCPLQPVFISPLPISNSVFSVLSSIFTQYNYCSHYINCLSNNIHKYLFQYFYGLSHIVLII